MRIGEWWKRKRERWIGAILMRMLSPYAMECMVWKHRDILERIIQANRLTQPLVYGSKARLHVDGTAVINNAMFNTLGGDIFIGPEAFFGHDVSLLTGTHDIHLTGQARKETGSEQGRDIVVGPGVWLATRVIVVGPATIGANAVVGAGSVVLGDVEPGTLYAGIPAKKIKNIELRREPEPVAARPESGGQ